MTLVEFFTDNHIQNIAACLQLAPEKMILVGDIAKIRRSPEQYRKVLQMRGIRTQIQVKDIRKKDFWDITYVLQQIFCTDETFVVDLTGGDELVLMAMGALLSTLDSQQRSHISIHKFDDRMERVLDCLDDNRIVPGKLPELTVAELIQLHGGTIREDNAQPKGTPSRRELDRLWDVVSEDPRQWNRSISLLREAESRCGCAMDVDVELEVLKNSIQGFAAKEPQLRRFLETLSRCGVICDRSSRYDLRYSYTSPLLRYCTLKAGNVLEIKVLLETSSLLLDGEAFFQDCRMGVTIDWDGVIHDPAARIPETRNEIDVVAMHNLTPLFISCKNGTINEDELYKLHTVAAHFGGPHARMLLVATDMDQKTQSVDHAFIQRAWDMNIRLMTDAASLRREEWRELFKIALQ